MTIARYGRSRFWAVYDEDGILICLTVYRKGAEEIVRRLSRIFDHNSPSKQGNDQ